MSWMKSEKKNGKLNGHVVLDAPEQDELRALEQAAVAAGQNKMLLEAQFFTAYSAHALAVQAFTSRVATVARAHGIDPDDPAKGKWEFNFTSMSFTKQPTT